jgi:hypothetical protein
MSKKFNFWAYLIYLKFNIINFYQSRIFNLVVIGQKFYFKFAYSPLTSFNQFYIKSKFRF